MHVFKLACVAILLFCLSVPAEAQGGGQDTVNVSDTLSSSTDSFVVPVRGMASARFQTRDSYSGTWEVQCSLDGNTYDTDDEVNLSLEGASSAAVQEVTDAVAIWTANIAGCTHIKVIATAGFAATDTVIAVSAIQSGGSSGSASSGSGNGTALADDADFTAGTTEFTPVGGFYQSTVTACTDGDTCAAGITPGRAVKVHFTDAAGATQTVASDKTEDVAHVDAATGPVPLSRRIDTAASSAGTSGDYATTNTNAEGGLWASNMAVSNGGCTIGTTTSIIGGASVNETQVKATAGQIYSISAFSLDATPVYLKLYNDTAANIDETDTPVYRLMIPAATTASLGSGLVFDFGVGLEFTTAITFRVTTGIADNSTGALTADEVLINVCYQ